MPPIEAFGAAPEKKWSETRPLLYPSAPRARRARFWLWLGRGGGPESKHPLFVFEPHEGKPQSVSLMLSCGT